MTRRLSFELFIRILTLPPLTGEIHHSTVDAMGGAIMAVGATAVLQRSVYLLIVRNVSRHVSRVFPFRREFSASHCKHFVWQGGIDFETRN